MNGQGKVDLQDGTCIEGSYIKNEGDGPFRRKRIDGVVEEYNLIGNRKSGLYIAKYPSGDTEEFTFSKGKL